MNQTDSDEDWSAGIDEFCGLAVGLVIVLANCRRRVAHRRCLVEFEMRNGLLIPKMAVTGA